MIYPRFKAIIPSEMLPAFNHRSRSQAQTFAVIAAYFDENRRVPTYRELAAMFGWSSTNASFQAVKTLIAAGAILKRPTPRGGFILVPVGRRVSNKRGKPGGRLKKAPQGRKRKAKQNQQDTEFNPS